ncbi:LysR family transcriptional regulator [Phenylobacterium sp.]|uniref:helix-turn-helix domain-containing protein n=1 Tax=Phenylobacterium sp. TaxID=1871053 RepID=UPI0027336516|nr:LysR family transcriptional regulator [Phenylobacterium sp.]MDP3661014.1 LysR family transcriptional regulator [Phenylobacterium sp.]
MELTRVRQFLTLAEVLNFHRAAEILDIAQPPLSVSIAKLEAELGAPQSPAGIAVDYRPLRR